MFTGAVSYWFRGWSITAVIILLILLNILVKNDLITSEYQAYGLDYNTERAEYSLDRLKDLSRAANRREDKLKTLGILQNWEVKVR